MKFCEMVREPEKYFDKKVRLTALFSQATEGAYLSDASCPSAYDDQVGLVVDNDPDEPEKAMADRARLSEHEFGGEAVITVTGTLRNISRRDFAWYRWRFDVSSFENISHVVNEFTGDLQAGKTYRAKVRYDKLTELTTVTPYKFPMHYAVRFEWLNIGSFPELKSLRKTDENPTVIFTVIAEKSVQVSERMWRRTVNIKIQQIE